MASVRNLPRGCFSRVVRRGALALLAGVFCCGLPATAGELTKFTNVRLIDSPANDGDSFQVELGSFQVDLGGRRLHARLYFADCPETLTSTNDDLERVREQARYFGLTDETDVVRTGRQAAAYTKQRLGAPFTLYTAFEDAMGRSFGKRYYVFVVTADGKDLASELVERGYARAYGRSHPSPDGKDAWELEQRGRDLEDLAKIKRAGAWARTDPEQMVRMRAEGREKRRELNALRRDLAGIDRPAGRLDLNAATPEQLQEIPGIGPALAGRIVAGRPYRRVEDLTRLKGIGSKLLEGIRPYLTVPGQTKPTPGG